MRSLHRDDAFAIPQHPLVWRWLPDFLASTQPWQQHPELAEIARFEWTLTLAFDAPEAAALTFDDLAAIPPDAWSTLQLQLHPSLHTLALRSNAPALRTALDAEARLPSIQRHADPVEWAVWRKAGVPHFRSPEVRSLGYCGGTTRRALRGPMRRTPSIHDGRAGSGPRGWPPAQLGRQ